jgi:hypothetical protein
VRNALKGVMKVLIGGRMRLLAIAIVVIVIIGGAVLPIMAGKSDRLLSVPALHAGQKFVYRVRYKTQKVTRSENRIATPLVPEARDKDTERYVAVEVEKVQGVGSGMQVVMRTQLLPTDGGSRSADEGVVEFTLLADGRADGLRGFDVLSADEQALWRQWITQFALGWTFPPKGVKLNEKWKKEEPVVGAVLARLEWEKQIEYVRDEACPATGDGDSDGHSAVANSVGQCAVVVTTSTMKQQGSHDDTTPEDYKLHQLKTSGAAKGRTDVLTFISLKTGFLERANEDSAQTLDVLVAKADESNRTHLNVEATSHAEVVLVH